MTKVAWDHPQTPVGYQRLVVRRAAWLVGLLSSAVIAGAGLVLGLLPHALLIFSSVVAVVVPFLPVVVVAFCRRRRIASILQTYPWCELPYETDPQTASLVVIRFTDQIASTFRLFPFPVQLAADAHERSPRLWFAGDPRFGGVVSPVGGHYPVRVVPHAPRREECGGDGFDLALRVGLVRRSGKGTRT
ncbi:hypothetical protein ACFWUZ_01105 [Streptomyces sp. NPDC058646]|uniref:hypothetical protein n=1 Tax=Streptomyces sp. NPDC058646 TaxID=3346574 RepID=UPI0036627394